MVLLLALALAATTPDVSAAASSTREVTRLIVPGAPLTQSGAPLILPTSSAQALILPTPAGLITPTAPVIHPPSALIVPASRALTEAEAAPAQLPSQRELESLAEALSPSSTTPEREADKSLPQALNSAFDGARADAAGWREASLAPDNFAQGPLAPPLSRLETVTRALLSRLLPRLYRSVPVTAAYARDERVEAGHTWTSETGHLIKLSPISADSQGEVPSAFGLPGQIHVQQKIERLMFFAHEYAHVLFDSALRRTENHPLSSTYAALTEGFSVTVEQLLIEGMLTHAPLLRLSPRDVMDLSAIARARRQWLDIEDTHYSEGIIPWRRAYAQGGEAGVLSFLASLSARRLIATPRSDPAYQLILGDPKLLSAYLGASESSAERRGADAFGKAAAGKPLSEDEGRAAATIVEQAGPEGRRRLFERTLLSDKRFPEPAALSSANDWWKEKPLSPDSVRPAFASARLSPSAAAELALFLVETAQAPGGLARLFERPGPNARLTAIVSGAEALSWDDNGRRAWMDALARWLVATR